MTAQQFPRPITPEEAAIVRRILDLSDYPAAAECCNPVMELEVSGGCDCGCASLYFGGLTAPFVMLADLLVCYPDGKIAGILLWGQNREVAWLEVYEMDEGVHRRQPRGEDLCRWEDAASRCPRWA